VEVDGLVRAFGVAVGQVLVAVHQFIAPLVSKSDTDTEVGTELETGGEITLTDLAAGEQVTTSADLGKRVDSA